MTTRNPKGRTNYAVALPERATGYDYDITSLEGWCEESCEHCELEAVAVVEREPLCQAHLEEMTGNPQHRVDRTSSTMTDPEDGYLDFAMMEWL